MNAEEYARLEAAERVCTVFGWTEARDGTDREKALTELWQQWRRLVPAELLRDQHPELSDEEIAKLARQRDRTRARTLERIRRTGQ